MTPDKHLETSRTFIEQAFIEYERGDFLQASEKTWGAAAHAVKSAAGRRGWQHDSHRLLFIAIDRIISETGQHEIRALFQTANNSHKNFYAGWMNSQEVEDNIAEVEKLLAILNSVRR